MQPETTPTPPRREGMTPGRIALNTLAVLGVLLGAFILVQVREILVLLLIGILLASAIEPIVDRLQARGFGRGQSVVLVYVILAVALGALVWTLVPALVREVTKFFTAAPKLLDDLRASVQTSNSQLIRENGPYIIDEIESRITQADISTERALTLATYLPSLLGYLLQGVITIVTTLMIAFYWITEKAIIKRVFLSSFVSDERRARVNAIWDSIETKLGGWIRGQLILMGLMGLIASAGYYAMGLRFAVLLGIVTGLCEIIPVFGPWISGIPATLVALTTSWKLALAVIAFTLAIQMLEGNILVPRVMKGTIGLSPLLVVLAVLIGLTILGPAGGIIAIPIAAALQVLISDLVRGHHDAIAAEAAQSRDQVFRWRPGRLPQRLQGVRPGPAVVSPVVELSPPPERATRDE